MTTPDPTFCAAPGCKRGPQRGQLCGQHHDHLGRTVADLADLIAADAGGNLTGWRTGHVSGGMASERDPGNLRLMSSRSEATVILAAWADWLRGARQLHLPTAARIEYRGGRLVTYRTAAPPDPAVDRRLLADHLDWIAAQPEAAQFWVQIRAVWSDLKGYRPVRACTCTDPYTGQHGPVWSEVGGGWCSWCGTAWSGADLLRLPPVEVAA